jgi:hypothetical protein
MTHGEYAANKSGLNIFFGAIIGVIMADVESLGAAQYSILLVATASLVVTLLFIGASRRPLIYFLVAAFFLFSVYGSMERYESELGVSAQWIANRYLPVFAVWLGMLAVVEFAPRERPKPETGASSMEPLE